MKIKDKEIWIIVISAIILISAFVFTARAASTLTGIMVFRDIPLTQDQYKSLGTETFSATFLLPSGSCIGFVNYCDFEYQTTDIKNADIYRDGKIDNYDIYAMVAAYDCKLGDACWNQPVEQCYFVMNGRPFKDPTRDCKINQSDINLITSKYGLTHNKALTADCENDEVCKADMNQDGVVDIYDVSLAGSLVGKTADTYLRLLQSKAEADINGDGKVDIFDVAAVTINYGKNAIIKRCPTKDMIHDSGRKYSISLQGIGTSWIQVAYECPI
jgi:hypothetical protein